MRAMLNYVLLGRCLKCGSEEGGGEGGDSKKLLQGESDVEQFVIGLALFKSTTACRNSHVGKIPRGSISSSCISWIVVSSFRVIWRKRKMEIFAN